MPPSPTRAQLEANIARMPRAEREKLWREMKPLYDERCRRDAEKSLMGFIRLLWPVVEPKRKLAEGWLLDGICEHLEAVANGQITRLIMNVPPGSMKSLTTNVFFPAWLWGPKNRPDYRFVGAAYTSSLTMRDNTKFKRIIESAEFRLHWGDRFGPLNQVYGTEKVENDRTGFKLATSVGGVGTGERGDFVILDDPNNVLDAESEATRDATNIWFREVIPTRLNDAEKSAIIIIQQRTHEEDVTGVALDLGLGYEQFVVPMELDDRHCVTSIGWEDPRTEPGELAWPERFSRRVVERDKIPLGPYGVAAQFQQMPSPKGGGIVMNDWWQPWENEDKDGRVQYPICELVVAGLDTALTEKTHNDPSAMTVWGVWRDDGVRMNYHGQLLEGFPQPKAMIMGAWQAHIPLHPAKSFEESEFFALEDKEIGRIRWEHTGLVERTAATCRRRKVDVLLIENKANGYDVYSEIMRLYQDAPWRTIMYDPTKHGDKVARLYSVTPLFSAGLVYAPHKDGVPLDWVDMVMRQVASFPKAKRKDLTDTTSMTLRWLRDQGIIRLHEERGGEVEEAMQRIRPARPLYPV